MHRLKKHGWRTGFFIILLVAIGAAVVMVHRDSNHRGKNLFRVAQAPLIALDAQTFNDPARFDQAAIFTSPTFSLTSIQHLYKNKITSLTGVSLQDQKFLYATDGYDIIKMTLSGEQIEHVSFRDALDSPIEAFCVHPQNPRKLLGLLKSHHIVSIDVSQKIPSLQILSKTGAIPRGMKIQEMWTHPYSQEVTLAVASHNGSLLITLNPLNWKVSTGEILIPNVRIKGGFHISQQLIVAVDDEFNLHIIDTDKKQIIGNYVADPSFAFANLRQTQPTGFVALGTSLYLSESYNQLMHIQGKPQPHAIIINRDVDIQEGKLVLHWKTPKQSSKALFMAELNVNHQLVPFGPMEQNYIELPIAAPVASAFDISLFSIDKRNGKILSPAKTFSIQARRGIAYE